MNSLIFIWDPIGTQHIACTALELMMFLLVKQTNGLNLFYGHVNFVVIYICKLSHIKFTPSRKYKKLSCSPSITDLVLFSLMSVKKMECIRILLQYVHIFCSKKWMSSTEGLDLKGCVSLKSDGMQKSK